MGRGEERGGGPKQGFTLIEVLVTLGIILFLAAVVVPASLGQLDQAKAAQEIAGARKTITGWLNYASENDGSLLVGYLDSSDPELANVKNAQGQTVGGTAARRYAYRLAPYLDYELKGSFLVNKQKTLKDEYSISLLPSFGINLTFIGGDYGIGTLLNPRLHPEHVAKKLVQIHSPSKMIVFASARYSDGALGKVEGYNALKPPFVTGRVWANVNRYEADRPFYDYGAMDLRYKDRAVCVMADGHTELLDYKQLEDMRRWSNEAAAADDPAWVLSL